MKTAENNRDGALKKTLVGLRDLTYERVRELRRDQRQESESGPADEGDLARTTADVETHAGLIAQAEEKLKFLDDALSRLEQGKYGECMGCHEPIPLERLAVLPFVAYCVDCQQKRNRAREGWSSGGMIPPYDHQWTLPEEMEGNGEGGRAPATTVETSDFLEGEPLEAGTQPPDSDSTSGRRRRGRPPGRKKKAG